MTPRRASGGRALLEATVVASEGAGLWTLQAGIFPENVPSLRLHAVCGFRTIGRRERIGQVHGVWRDVLLLERRSDRRWRGRPMYSRYERSAVP